MSHMVCYLSAYDVMGDVFVHVTVTDHDINPSDPEQTNTWATTFPGTGEQYQPKWLRDVLQEVLEVL